MAQSRDRYLRLIGLLTWGDLGPLTIYRSRRNRLVAYPKAPPDKPPSPSQTAWRNALRTAAAAWHTFSPTYKPNWDRACRRLSLPITGYNLFIAWQIRPDRSVIATIERQSGLALLPPTPPAASSSSSSSAGLP